MQTSAIDPRGVMRKITNVDPTPEVTLVTKSCGHTGNHAQHFHYTVGENIFCYECGEEARKALNS